MSDVGTSSRGVIWGLAAAAGVVAFLVLSFLMQYAFWSALVLAVLIAVLVAILIWIGFYRDEEAPGAGRSETAPPPDRTATPTATAAPPADQSGASGAKPAPASPARAAASEADRPAAGMMGDAGIALKAANEGKPAALKAPRGGRADDLKRIRGIGPKLEELLNSMGFFHYDQIAGWSESEVAWVNNNLTGFKGRVSRDNWVEQAATLAGGGETAFSRKADKGGAS